MADNKKQYRRDLIKILGDAEEEVQQNYLRILQPIAQEYSEFLKTLEINVNCNETCVAHDCFSIESFVMDWNCVVRDCQCNVNSNRVRDELRDMKDAA